MGHQLLKKFPDRLDHDVDVFFGNVFPGRRLLLEQLEGSCAGTEPGISAPWYAEITAAISDLRFSIETVLDFLVRNSLAMGRRWSGSRLSSSLSSTLLFHWMVRVEPLEARTARNTRFLSMTRARSFVTRSPASP